MVNVLKALLNSFYRLLEMHVPVLAGGLAFFGAISVFPLLAPVLLCYGFLSTPADAIAFVDSVKHLMPKDAHPAISSELALLADWAPHHLTPSILLAIALITWSAMSGWKALIAGVRLVAHDHSQISIAGFQFRSLLLSFFSIGAIVTAIVVFVLFARILAAPESGAEIATPQAAAAVGALAWFIAITVFDYYAETASWLTIYGTLTGIIAFLLWFYISAYTAMLGAAFAASMNESEYT